jgi:hypothetical protein
LSKITFLSASFVRPDSLLTRITVASKVREKTNLE